MTRKTLDKLLKVSFVSLGCPKNLVDSEVMLGNFVKDGFYVCEDYEDSDVVVINTCGFLKESEDESLDVINSALKLKKQGKIKGVVVAGCLPQRYGNEIENRLPDEVDGIIGITDKDKLPKLCRNILNNGHDKMWNLVSSDLPKYEVDRERLRLTPRHFGYVRVSEGCDHTCAFCVIPQIRGGFRSKPMEVIIDEVKELANDGAKEINLIAQDTTMYGLDIYRKLKLPELLDKIADVNGIQWIRLLYCYPTFVNDALVNAIAENPKVVKYIDMPIQHTTEKMLRLMRRGITEERQKEAIELLRRKVMGLFIRSTLIVGFPGETEDDFNKLVDDLRTFEFERLGTFRYSNEPGSRAYDMPDHVADEEKERRFNTIMAIQQEIAFKKNRQLIYKTLDVIADKKVNGHYEGRTYGDAPDVDGIILLNGKNIKVGNIYKAKVTNTKCYDLEGEIVNV